MLRLLAQTFFQGLRPVIVTDEGQADRAFSSEAVAEAAMSDKVSAMDLPVSSEFEKQFVSEYSCRVFPWALNYECGGADYPELFADWAWLEKWLHVARATTLSRVFRSAGGV